MQKILITTTGLESVGQPGGISSYAHSLARILSDKGFSVVVYLFHESSKWNRSPVIPYEFHFFQIPTEYRQEKDFTLAVLASISELKPDVIINNDVSYLSGLWAILPREIVKISVMHGFHKGITQTNLGLQGKHACYNHEYIDWIICQNKRMAHDASRKYGVPSNKLLCISQTALDERSISQLQEKAHSKQLKLICACGGGKSKGGDVMRKLAKRLLNSDINFELVWCLPVPTQWKKELNSPKILFFDKLSHTEFMQKMQSSHIAIIPTTMDTGPLLVVEALNCGTVPICNDLRESAIPDVIVDNENGYRIAANSIDSYMEIIHNLYYSDSLLKKIANNAASYYFAHLSNNHFAESFIYLFTRKQSNRTPKDFSDEDIVCFHLHNVANNSKISLKRQLNKLFCLLEYVVTYKRHHKFLKHILR